MIENLTPLEDHRAKVRAATLICINNADHLAQSMLAAYHIFWQPSPEIVLEILNSNIAHWLDVLQRNTSVGTTINAQLDAANLPEFSHRAPVVMPSGYAFNGSTFTYTPPVVPEPEPDEEPAPDDGWEGEQPEPQPE